MLMFFVNVCWVQLSLMIVRVYLWVTREESTNYEKFIFFPFKDIFLKNTSMRYQEKEGDSMTNTLKEADVIILHNIPEINDPNSTHYEELNDYTDSFVVDKKQNSSESEAVWDTISINCL